MKLKSFFADSVEQAIAMARREMGPDAMLINSKRSGPEAQTLGAWEVVCALTDEPAGKWPAPETQAVHASLGAPSGERLAQEVADLKRQMERLAGALAQFGSGLAGIGPDPERARAFIRLADSEVDTDLAFELISRVGLPASAHGFRAELGKLVNVNSDLGSGGASPRIVALVGPPGAGKTATLVKLAVQCGIAARRNVCLLTMDNYRVGAADELRAYAAILGIGCQALDSTAALAQALREHSRKDVILLDTPGLSAGEIEEFEDLAHFLTTTADLDTHLVLSASMRTSDMKRVAERYSSFGPGKLLFTHLDETETFGPMLSLSVKLGIPISFLARGQRIPEDLEPAEKDSVLDLILKPETAKSLEMAAA